MRTAYEELETLSLLANRSEQWLHLRLEHGTSTLKYICLWDILVHDGQGTQNLIKCKHGNKILSKSIEKSIEFLIQSKHN